MLVLAYGYDAAANVYRRAKLDTGGGYVARDLDSDGVIELVGDDFRFRGLFTCGACGPRPIRIWHHEPAPLRGGHARLPGKIRDHARRMRRFYERVRRRNEAAFVKGALTPLAADLCLLDRCGPRLPARARGDPARRARPPLDLRRLTARLRLPARAEALPAPDQLQGLTRSDPEGV